MTGGQLEVILGGIGLFLLGLAVGYLLSKKSSQHLIESIKANEQNLENLFSSISGNALKSNSEEFLRLAHESLKIFHNQAKGELEQKEQSISHLLKPLQEALTRSEKHTKDLEKERQHAYGSITTQLEGVARTQQQLQSETKNRADALKRPTVRGRWGELKLKRLVELAGMDEHIDFIEQEYREVEAGAIRPDMVIHLPGNREIVVDAKTPIMDSYFKAQESDSEEVRKKELSAHANKIRDKIKELAGKSYWAQFEHSPDFVVLFIPGEQFLSSALEYDNGLLEFALEQRVILATPANLIALLHTVAYGWRQESLAENAALIRDLGEKLHSRIAVFVSHLAKLGKNLNSGVDAYNKTVGSLERNVLSTTRKFEELGISSGKNIDNIEPVEKQTRNI